MVVEVKNLNGTSDKTPSCGCGSWRDHWIHNRGNAPSVCRCCGKMDLSLLGGHVKLTHSEDKREYIVPICSSCNNTKDKIFLTDFQNLVLANTCKDKTK